MSKLDRSHMDLLLDWLADEVTERLQARSDPALSTGHPAEPAYLPAPLPGVSAAQLPYPSYAPQVPVTEPEPEPEPEPELPPPPPSRSHAARLMGRLGAGLLAVVVLINIPLNRHGLTLATAVPDSAALVVLDGLVVKEADEEEIYVYQDDQFRWISSMDAFEHYGFTWGDVHVVEDGFLERFEVGTPLHVLLKCSASPHIYRLEGGVKRWIVDIETFQAEGHVWEDVSFVSCSYLRNLPDGETIPPGHGPAPQP